MRKRTIYECSYCNKRRLLSKSAMRKHEKECFYNHDNKTCVTCWNNRYNGKINYCHIDGSTRNLPMSSCPYWTAIGDFEEEE